MIKKNKMKRIILPLALSMALSSQATEIKVKVENLSPQGGVFLTPLWVGFHDGSFDSYDTGSPASAGLERIAEDGDASELSALFTDTTPNGLDAVILNPEGFAGAPVFEPGSVSYEVFDLDETTQRYFSYANMVIPSNDAFVANANPLSHPIFDESGEFTGPFTFTVYGTQIRDAGTEENTESDAAFLNQSAGNTGNTTSDNISVHPGFNGSIGNPEATPVNILGGTVASGDVIDPVNGDFTNGHYPLMKITVSKTTTPVRLSIKNATPTNGIFLTPFWVAFHDGGFDTYNTGDLASDGLELVAEEGDSSTLSTEFSSLGNGIDAVITNPEGFEGAPLFDPGLSTSQVFELDPEINKYFSYASMVLPSNDAFIANADSKGHQIFDQEGHFAGGVYFKVYGSQVRDAGTEENNESGAPFFNATDPSVNTSENITVHPGFNGSVGNPDATPQIFLGGTNGPGFTFGETEADFSIEGYQVAEIAISRMVDGSMSGTWFNAQRAGLLLEITDDSDSQGSRAVVSMYTYTADGSQQQSWIIGSGPVVGDTALVDMQITTGTSFGKNFNPDEEIKTPWGELSIKFHDCENATLSFQSVDPNYGSDTYALSRLTTGPVDYKGACQL